MSEPIQYQCQSTNKCTLRHLNEALFLPAELTGMKSNGNKIGFYLIKICNNLQT